MPPDQQRVIEKVAQPGERMADGGLALVQPDCRPRDVAFGQQGLQNDEQIEIDTRKTIHLVHIMPTEIEFPYASPMM